MGKSRRSRRRKKTGRILPAVAVTAVVAVAAVFSAAWMHLGGCAADGALESAGMEEIQTDAFLQEPGDQPEETVEAALAQPGEGEPEQPVEDALQEQAVRIVSGMTPEQKVAQLFIITPEALTGYDRVVQAGEATRQALEQYPVGGLIYFSGNLQNPEQLKAMTGNVQSYAEAIEGLPLFLSIDEEGGDIARIGNHSGFAVDQVPRMSEIGAAGDTGKAYEAGGRIGAYLEELGLNLDFAPDADVLTNPSNTVVKNRSFGSDPQLVADMVRAYREGLESHQVYGVPKHFPGHGATEEDSHKEFAYVRKSWEELEQAELVPFRDQIREGVSFLMVGHISLPEILGTDLPASLSGEVITGYLREQMGYDGIVITDALNMGAIQNHYTSADACILAFQSGVDMLLMPADFHSAYDGMLSALESGEITGERLDASVMRIVKAKLRWKLLDNS